MRLANALHSAPALRLHHGRVVRHPATRQDPRGTEGLGPHVVQMRSDADYSYARAPRSTSAAHKYLRSSTFRRRRISLMREATCIYTDSEFSMPWLSLCSVRSITFIFSYSCFVTLASDIVNIPLFPWTQRRISIFYGQPLLFNYLFYCPS